MSMSGIAADAECYVAFEKMKLKKENRYILFKVSDDGKKIVIDEIADADKTFDDFLAKIEALEGTGQCRYCLYDFHVNSEGRNLQKLIFIFWCPESAKVSSKMIYSSSKETLKKGFEGVNIEFQCNDLSDVCYESMRLAVVGKP